MKLILVSLILVLAVISFPYGESFKEDYETLLELGEKQIEKGINFYQYNCFVTSEKRAEMTFIFKDDLPELSILKRVENLAGVFVIKLYKPAGVISSFEVGAEYYGRKKEGGFLSGSDTPLFLLKPNGVTELDSYGSSLVDIQEEHCIVAMGTGTHVSELDTLTVELYISKMEINFRILE